MAKIVSAAELRGQSRADLDARVRELKEELFTLRFQSATGQLESHGRLRAVRKDIARIYTVLQERGARKVREGYVVSDKMDKTVVVAVEDRVKHRLYGKVLRQTVRVKAHDEGNTAGVGDRVRVMETRPLSATKRWRLVEILEKAK